MAHRRAPPPAIAINKLLAYVARYGHQPYSEMTRLTRRALVSFGKALEAIVERENTPSDGG